MKQTRVQCVISVTSAEKACVYVQSYALHKRGKRAKKEQDVTIIVMQILPCYSQMS